MADWSGRGSALEIGLPLDESSAAKKQKAVKYEQETLGDAIDLSDAAQQKAAAEEASVALARQLQQEEQMKAQVAAAEAKAAELLARGMAKSAVQLLVPLFMLFTTMKLIYLRNMVN